MKLLRWIFGALVGVLVVGFIGFNVAIAAFRDRLFDLYMHELDAWVAAADPKTIQNVVESCGRLVMTQAGWFERIQLSLSCVMVVRQRRDASIQARLGARMIGERQRAASRGFEHGRAA